eukprot:COSAG06_NODE_475_length_15278_cov_5.364187_5_plen_85_part_00
MSTLSYVEVPKYILVSGLISPRGRACTRGRRPQRRAIVSGGPTPPLVRCWFQYKFQSVQLARLSPRFAQNTAYFRRFSLEKAVN